MLQKLSLENFRSHKKTEFEFAEGNNVLIGISGSGKSSVLDAICFALYGNTPKLQARKLKVADLIMDKPTPEDEAKITLNFELSGKNYEIIRILSKTKPTYAELRIDGALKATSTTQVTEITERALKANFELFSKIIYSEQNQLDYFLTVQKGDRMAKIDELLKLQKFERARQIATSFKNKLLYKAKNLSESAEKFDEGALKSEKARLEEEIRALGEEINALTQKNKTSKNEADLLEKSFSEMSKAKSEIEALAKKKQELSGAISLIENELKEMPKGDIETAQKEFEAKKAIFEERSKAEEARKKEIALAELRLKDRQKQLEEKEKAGEFLKNFSPQKAARIEESLKALRESQSHAKIEKKSLEKALLQLKSAENMCPTCDSPLSEEKKSVLEKEKKEALQKTEKLLESIEKDITEFEGKFAAEKKSLEYAKFYEKRLEQIGPVEEEINSLNSSLKALLEKKIEVDSSKADYESAKSKKDALERRALREARLKEFKERFGETENLLKEMKFDDNAFEKLRQSFEDKKREVLLLSKDLDYKQKIALEKESTFKKVREGLNFLEKNASEIEYLKYSTETLGSFSNILTDVQGRLREEFVATLNEVMNAVWAEIYPYEDYSEIRFKIEENDYLLQLFDLKGKWVNVEGIVSGGERAIASLVMRVALSVTLAPNLRLLILDEPTHNLDSGTIEKLTEILKTKISSLIDQIFIVTHDERLIQAATAYTYELKREAGKKEPTKVEKIENFFEG
jgi:DNA repair exonuclease SbcCD ATPase subunit